MGKKPGSQARLKKNVLEKELCTGCGACVGLCPYQVIYKDRTVQLFDCDLQEGKCYNFCPRTPVDQEGMRKRFFDKKDFTPEIGAVKGYLITRSTDPALRELAQHGGTVTTLLETAMDEGLIDSAIESGMNDEQEQEGILLKNKALLRSFMKSKFTVSPTLAAFNRLSEESSKNVGVVVTPCQALALAKMKTAGFQDYAKIKRLKLVIGLFCGWTLSMERFRSLLKDRGVAYEALSGMDIPPGKNVLELYAGKEIKEVSLSEIEKCIRTCCRYCTDSTAEFADISVGAARFGVDPEEMRGWNQVIIRSSTGKDLVDRAVAKGLLEIREVPSEIFQNLKKAAAEKKKKALHKIIEKSRSATNLLYLRNDDPFVKKYLK